MKSRKLGIIAGAGSLPELACAEAIRAGWAVYFFPLSNDRSTPAGVTGVHPIQIGSPLKALQTLILSRVTDLLLIGKVPKAPLAREELDLDEEAKKIISRAPTGRDDDLMLSIVDRLQRAGFRVRDQREFLSPYLASEGPIVGSPLSKKTLAEAWGAFQLAKQMGGLDIGQTVVFKGTIPVAVEALEGTDETIKRAGQLAGPGCLVAKVAKPSQDFRFDVPTVGSNTLQAMADAEASTLVVEAGAVLIIGSEEFREKAAQWGIGVYGMAPAQE